MQCENRLDTVSFSITNADKVPNLLSNHEQYKSCMHCQARLKKCKDKHNCNLCGKVFCDRCTRQQNVPERFVIGGSNKKKQGRVCFNCCNVALRRQLLKERIGVWIESKERIGSASTTALTINPLRNNTAAVRILDMQRLDNIRKEYKRTRKFSLLHEEQRYIYPVTVWDSDIKYDECTKCNEDMKKKKMLCRCCGRYFCERCTSLMKIPEEFESAARLRCKKSHKKSNKVVSNEAEKKVLQKARNLFTALGLVAPAPPPIDYKRDQNGDKTTYNDSDSPNSNEGTDLESSPDMKKPLSGQLCSAIVCDSCRFLVHKGAQWASPILKKTVGPTVIREDMFSLAFNTSHEDINYHYEYPDYDSQLTPVSISSIGEDKNQSIFKFYQGQNNYQKNDAGHKHKRDLSVLLDISEGEENETSLHSNAQNNNKQSPSIYVNKSNIPAALRRLPMTSKNVDNGNKKLEFLPVFASDNANRSSSRLSFRFGSPTAASSGNLSPNDPNITRLSMDTSSPSGSKNSIAGEKPGKTKTLTSSNVPSALRRNKNNNNQDNNNNSNAASDNNRRSFHFPSKLLTPRFKHAYAKDLFSPKLQTLLSAENQNLHNGSNNNNDNTSPGKQRSRIFVIDSPSMVRTPRLLSATKRQPTPQHDTFYSPRRVTMAMESPFVSSNSNNNYTNNIQSPLRSPKRIFFPKNMEVKHNENVKNTSNNNTATIKVSPIVHSLSETVKQTKDFWKSMDKSNNSNSQVGNNGSNQVGVVVNVGSISGQRDKSNSITSNTSSSDDASVNSINKNDNYSKSITSLSERVAMAKKTFDTNSDSMEVDKNSYQKKVNDLMEVLTPKYGKHNVVTPKYGKTNVLTPKYGKNNNSRVSLIVAATNNNINNDKSNVPKAHSQKIFCLKNKNDTTGGMKQYPVKSPKSLLSTAQKIDKKVLNDNDEIDALFLTHGMASNNKTINKQWKDSLVSGKKGKPYDGGTLRRTTVKVNTIKALFEQNKNT